MTIICASNTTNKFLNMFLPPDVHRSQGIKPSNPIIIFLQVSKEWVVPIKKISMGNKSLLVLIIKVLVKKRVFDLLTNQKYLNTFFMVFQAESKSIDFLTR